MRDCSRTAERRRADAREAVPGMYRSQSAVQHPRKALSPRRLAWWRSRGLPALWAAVLAALRLPRTAHMLHVRPQHASLQPAQCTQLSKNLNAFETARSAQP